MDINLTIANYTENTFFRFAIVGGGVLALENVIIYVLELIGTIYLLSMTIATVIAVFVSYIVNTLYSFKAELSVKGFVSYVIGVSLSVIVIYIVSLITYYYIFNHTRPLWSLNIGSAVAVITNYIYQRFVTYR